MTASAQTTPPFEEDNFADYNPQLFADASKQLSAINPAQAIETAGRLLKVVSNDSIMSSIETVLRESYKFIRLADDLHDIKWYLNDIRLCFIALTISGYVGILLYGLVLCFTRRRRGGASRAPTPRRQGSAQPDEEAAFGVGGGGGGAWRPGDDSSYRTNPNRTPETYNRYPTRSLNRTALHHNAAPKLDSIVVDSIVGGQPGQLPKKQVVVENHAGGNDPPSTVTMVARENGGIATYGL